MAEPEEKTSTAAKINFVLTEVRVVLPGVQALFGFQLAIVLTKAFEELDVRLKWVHGSAISFIVIATILLMTPAAYHRIVYAGADVPNFYRIASRLLLAATVFLALGLGADLYVAASKITANHTLSLSLAAAALVVLVGLWHVWPLWRRHSVRASDDGLAYDRRSGEFD